MCTVLHGKKGLNLKIFGSCVGVDSSVFSSEKTIEAHIRNTHRKERLLTVLERIGGFGKVYYRVDYTKLVQMQD